MIVAGLQPATAWQAPDANFRQATELAEEAAADGARLVVLPEAFATGFSAESASMAVHADAVRSFLSTLAERLGVWVLGGYIEPGDRRPVNAASLVAPDGGERLHIRKIHPFSLAGEQRCFESGDRIGSFTVDGVRITPLICYDLRFVELFRATACATDCFVVIANWPEARARAWRILLAARAIDCQAYVLGVNRVGDAGGYCHRGQSMLVDPLGEVVARLDDAPGVVAGEVDADRVARIRSRYPFLADRRPEVYDAL